MQYCALFLCLALVFYSLQASSQRPCKRQTLCQRFASTEFGQPHNQSLSKKSPLYITVNGRNAKPKQIKWHRQVYSNPPSSNNLSNEQVSVTSISAPNHPKKDLSTESLEDTPSTESLDDTKPNLYMQEVNYFTQLSNLISEKTEGYDWKLSVDAAQTKENVYDSTNNKKLQTYNRLAKFCLGIKLGTMDINLQPSSVNDVLRKTFGNEFTDISDFAKAVSIEVRGWPNFNITTPHSPTDRRELHSENLRIVTFNTRHLCIHEATEFKHDSILHNFLHAITIAHELSIVNADVVVLQEVSSFAVLEMVRAMMPNGQQYRAYCPERSDPKIHSRVALLTKIDPVSNLFELRYGGTRYIRHFIARLGVHVGQEIKHVDILGLHLVRMNDWRQHVQESLFIADALIRRKQFKDGHIPVIVAGDINSSFIHLDKLKPKEKRLKRFPGSVYALTYRTDLVSCHTDNTRGNRAIGGLQIVDTVLVSDTLVNVEADIACQLQTKWHTPGRMYLSPIYFSDHFPLEVTVNLNGPSASMVSSCPLTETLQRLRDNSFLESPSPAMQGAFNDKMHYIVQNALGAFDPKTLPYVLPKKRKREDEF